MVCSVCGFEPLPVDESGRVKVQPNCRRKLLERRMRKLNEFGIFGAINTSVLSAITEEQGTQLRETSGVRGLTSVEASVIMESKDILRRAIAMGYTCVEDRHPCDRAHQEGRSLRDCIHDDPMAFGNLPDPPIKDTCPTNSWRRCQCRT